MEDQAPSLGYWMEDQDQLEDHSNGSPEYTDVSDTLFACLRDLQEGQMVFNPSFTLEQSMAAIQITDPRMDVGIHPPPENLVADSDKLPSGATITVAFDPVEKLSAADVCWIMDRALACEAAWHQGATLQQTIHTCLYIYATARIHPKAPGPVPALVGKVLRPFVIALLKSIGLAWDELVKDHVADLEDFSAEKAGVSLLEEVPPSEAIVALDEAIAFLEEYQNGEEEALSRLERRSMIKRLHLRRQILAFFYTFALATSSPTSSHQEPPLLPSIGAFTVDTLDLLDRLEPGKADDCLGFMSPALADAPSPRALAAFDPNHSRRLATMGCNDGSASMPPPHPISLGTPKETSTFWRRTITDMEEAYWFHSSFGWRTWKTFLTSRAIRSQRWPRCAYVRSLFQSIICTGHVIGLNRTLDDLSDDFLRDLAGVPIDTLKRLADEAFEEEVRERQAADRRDATGARSQQQANRQMDVTGQLAWFLGRLPGHLVEHLNILAQTRARGHRNLCKSYAGLVRLSEEAGTLGDTLARLLAGREGPQLDGNLLRAALQTLILDVVIQIVMAGLELELHRCEEYAVTYWVAAWAASERHTVLSALAVEAQQPSSFIIDNETKNELASSLADQAAVLEMLEKAFRGMFELCFDFPRSTTERHPWLPDEEDMHLLQGFAVPPEVAKRRLEDTSFLERDAFYRRFHWLSDRRRDGSASEDREVAQLWTSFVSDSTHLQSEPSTDRAARLLQEAALLCDDLDQAASEHEAFLPGLRYTLEHLAQRCQAHEILPTQLDFKNSPHPWFPFINDNIQGPSQL